MIRYFLSGASGIRPEVLPDVAALVDYRLLSMHEAFKGNTKVWTEVLNDPKSAVKEIMLDSGAFTAFTKGKKVKLDDLIATYESVDKRIKQYDVHKRVKHVWLINLDVIPGEYGRVAEPHEIDQALDESDENFKVLKKKFGDRVLPVFHQTESEVTRLPQIVSQNWFIAMGFRQDFSEEDRIQCAERALSYAHSKGVEVHGLATTGYRMLKRAPFDTVDSATWLYVAAMGGIMYANQAGEIDSLAISTRSPMQRDWRGHYRTITEAEQQFLEQHFADAGVTLKQLESDLSYRILFCAHQMREWLRNYQRPKVRAEKGLFA